MIVAVISGACRSQTVHISRTDTHTSQPMNPHSLLLESEPFSPERIEVKNFLNIRLEKLKASVPGTYRIEHILHSVSIGTTCLDC